MKAICRLSEIFSEGMNYYYYLKVVMAHFVFSLLFNANNLSSDEKNENFYPFVLKSFSEISFLDPKT